MKIIFIGTPKFASIILEKLINGGYKPVLAITSPDKPAGRKQVLTPSKVKITAQEQNICIEQPEKISSIKNKISSIKPDLIILAAYGQIIPKDILNIPKFGAINIHPSLLPKYRGASPIQSAILNKDKETGITIYFMDEKMDHGPIISSIRHNISNDIFYEKLCHELADAGADLLLKTLPKIESGKIKPKLQDDSKATYTKIIKKDDGRINWSQSAQATERKIRAYNPWPGCFTFWKKNGKMLRIKILKAEARILSEKTSAGKIISSSGNEILVSCKENFLSIKELQLEGKKPMKSNEFLKGYPDITGSVLE
jgi:methionyl-tRNA formyltransferase